MLSNSRVKIFFAFCAGILMSSGLSVAYAWTGPTALPPNGNVPAPLNVGSVDQIKNAGVGLNALAVFGAAFIQTKLGIGVESPVTKLDVAGAIKIGNAGELCQAATEGAVRYYSVSTCLQFCDGSSWKAVTTCTAVPPPATITLSPPSQTVSPRPVVNQPVFGSMSATGGTSPYAWSVSSGSLPPGYNLGSSGDWSGTVTTAGTYTATIRATDVNGNSGSATYTWPVGQVVISPAGTTINISGLGGPVSGSMSASGGNGPYSWAIAGGSLPPGYSMSSSGVFSGTVTTAGNYTATIRATDVGGAGGFSQETFTWNITP